MRDLATQEIIYEATPLLLDNRMWYDGFFLEYNGKIFLACKGTYDVAEIDFETGETIKLHSFFKDNNITITHRETYFSCDNEEYSVFCVKSKIIKYDKINDEFSLLVDTNISSENVDKTKGAAYCIFVSSMNPNNSFWIFTNKGICVNPINDILSGKYNSTKNYCAAQGFRADIFDANYQFVMYSPNEFISPTLRVRVMSSYGGAYEHTLGLSVDENLNDLGYFVKGELGAVFSRGCTAGFDIDMKPVYKRYGYDIH